MGWMCVNMLRQYMGQSWADTDTGSAWKPQLVSPLTDALLVSPQQQIQLASTCPILIHRHQVCKASISQNTVKWGADIV